jgi:RNA polymerase sigma-70 factor (ECF subfamily)
MKQDSNSPTMEALMQAAQAGDMRAYERLLREITPKLRQIVRRRRQFFTAEEVEDLVQEVLLSIHAVRATYDPRRPFMPWLSTIAHNRLIDSARRFYRGKSNEVQMDELPVTFADDWANVENEEYRDPEELSIAIKSLPEGQRKAVEMLKLREMSLKEAAAASGTTVGALKVSIHRAVLNLRKALNKE